jgi:hypothetical protein
VRVRLWVWSVLCVAVQWEGVMWLRRRVAARLCLVCICLEVARVLTISVASLMITVDICYGFNFIEFCCCVWFQ